MRPAYGSPDVLYLKSYDVQDSPTPSAPSVGVRRQMDWITGGTQESYTFDATGETGYWYTQRYTGTLAAGTYTATLYYTATGTTTLTIRPNAAGDSTGWTANGDTANYLCVDEASSDEDTTYVSCTLQNKEDLYNLEAHTTQTEAISNVRVYTRAKLAAAGDDQITIEVKTGGTVYSGTTVSLTTTYADYYSDWATNPQTGSAWTWAQIDALQAGFSSVKVGSAFPGERATQLYVVATYSRGGDLTLEVARTSPDGQTVTVIGTSTTQSFATAATVTSKVIDVTTTATPETFNDERLRLRITWSSGSITLYWDSSGTQSQLSTPSGTPPISEFPSTEFQIAILVINLLILTYLLRREKKSTRN